MNTIIPRWILNAEAIFFGLVIGSFLNVLIYRLPREMTMKGRSLCPQCHKGVAWYDNIPIFSFLILGAKCRYCRQKISWRYPLVESLAGFLSWMTLRQSNTTLEYFLWFLLFVAPLIVVVFTDIDFQIIPDAISIPGIPAGFLVTLILHSSHWTESLLFSTLGMLAGGGTLLALGQLHYWIRKKEGIGGGDIKLCAMFGAFLGWQAMIFIFLISSLTAVIYAVISMIISRSSKKEESPLISYGPFLVLAALTYFYYGSQILISYFGFFGIDPPTQIWLLGGPK